MYYLTQIIKSFITKMHLVVNSNIINIIGSVTDLPTQVFVISTEAKRNGGIYFNRPLGVARGDHVK